MLPSEITDREVTMSTTSVEWQINLQGRHEAHRISSPTQELQEQSDLDDKIDSEVEIDNDHLEDLDSCPSGSLGKEEDNFDLKVDQITDELLNSILRDFSNDNNAKMTVEDVNEDEFEDKWPWSLDKKQPEEPAHIAKAPMT